MPTGIVWQVRYAFQVLPVWTCAGVNHILLMQELLSLGFDSAVLLISAYANPVETIEHAKQQGYQVTDFMVTPMPFGLYSSEPKVSLILALQALSVCISVCAYLYVLVNCAPCPCCCC